MPSATRITLEDWSRTTLPAHDTAPTNENTLQHLPEMLASIVGLRGDDEIVAQIDQVLTWPGVLPNQARPSPTASSELVSMRAEDDHLEVPRHPLTSSSQELAMSLGAGLDVSPETDVTDELADAGLPDQANSVQSVSGDTPESHSATALGVASDDTQSRYRQLMEDLEALQGIRLGRFDSQQEIHDPVGDYPDVIEDRHSDQASDKLLLELPSPQELFMSNWLANFFRRLRANTLNSIDVLVMSSSSDGSSEPEIRYSRRLRFSRIIGF